MIDEKFIKKISKKFDLILKNKNITDEIIAIPWLHVIREHREFTDRYLSLKSSSYGFYFTKILYRIFLHILRSLKNFFFLKNKIKSHKISNNLDYLIVSHFLNINQTGKNTDFYFGKIPDIIKSFNKKVAIALINHTPYSSNMVLSRWKKKPRIPRIVFGKSINILSELGILIKLIKNFFKVDLFIKQKNNDFEKKISKELKKNLFSIDTVNNLKISHQIKYLVKFYKPKKIILIHEGHAHERIIFKSAREINKKIECIGYQHACIFRLQHSLKRNLNKDYNPNLILTSGINTKKILKNSKNIKNINIFNIGTHRSFNFSLRKSDYKKKVACLVIPEGLPEECSILFNFTIKYLEKFNNVKFIWRLHPIVSFKYLFENNYIPRKIQKNIILSKNSLETDIKNSRWSLYRGTTAIFSAVSGGTLPIYYNHNDVISTDPLYQIKGTKAVKNIFELNKILKNENLTNYKKIKNMSNYCNYTFEKYHMNNIKKIINNEI